jgi:hypothetical protein
VSPSEFSMPGSLLRVSLNTDDPLNYGMPGVAAVFVHEAIAYLTSPPAVGTHRSVVATYPAASEDILPYLARATRAADSPAAHRGCTAQL